MKSLTKSLYLACSVIALVLSTACGSPSTATSTVVSSKNSPIAIETTNSNPSPSATSVSPTAIPPTTDQIVQSLISNGFTPGHNEKYFKNPDMNASAYLDNGCDFSIDIIFDSTHNADAQIAMARNVLSQIYPSELVTYYDEYIPKLSNNALSKGQPISAPSKKTKGFMIGISSELHVTGGVLVSIFHPNTHYPVDMSSDD